MDEYSNSIIIGIAVVAFIAGFAIVSFIIKKFQTSRTGHRTISDEEAQRIREEYLKAEELRREAQLERDKAKTERERAEGHKRKAAEEWENIRNKWKSQEDKMEDPYSVLGLHESDSLDTIKEVYRRLAQIYHPDKFGMSNEISKKQKSNKVARINASYQWILEHHSK
jgi:hypothetical protein